MTSGAPPRSRPARELGLAALFFLAVTVLMTWPQAAHLGDALSDVWDAKLNARILQWDYAQTLRDPLDLYQLNFFHPAKLRARVLGEPVRGRRSSASRCSPPAPRRSSTTTSCSCWGCFSRRSRPGPWRARSRATRSPRLVAGLVFAFLPWRFSQLPHLQFQWAGVPLPVRCSSSCVIWTGADAGPRPVRDLLCVERALQRALRAVLGVARRRDAGPVRRSAGAEEGRRRWKGGPRGDAARRPRVRSLCPAVPRSQPALWNAALLRGDAVLTRRAGSIFSRPATGTGCTAMRPRRGGARRATCFPACWPWRSRSRPSCDCCVRARRGVAEQRPAVSAARLRLARALDAAILLLAGVWIWSLAREGLRVGPLHLGDPGRVFVFLTLAVAARLAAAFPRRAKSADLTDFVRARVLGWRAMLLLAIGAVGIVVALGANTPVLPVSLPVVRRASSGRSALPSRGIVLFHLALAVLAAWGLALLLRGRAKGRRLAWTGRPPSWSSCSSTARFRYASRRRRRRRPRCTRGSPRSSMPGAVVEWPFGLTYDFDYVFRQAAHGKPILNGYSGLLPDDLHGLEAQLKQRPIPDSVWPSDGRLGAACSFTTRTRAGLPRLGYADALDRALASGGWSSSGAFPTKRAWTSCFVAAGRREGAGPRGQRRRGSLPSRAASTRRPWRDPRDVARLAPPFGSHPSSGGRPEGRSRVLGLRLGARRFGDRRGPARNGARAGRPRDRYSMRCPGLGSGFPDYRRPSIGGFTFFHARAARRARTPDASPSSARTGGQTTALALASQVAEPRRTAPALAPPDLASCGVAAVPAILAPASRRRGRRRVCFSRSSRCRPTPASTRGSTWRGCVRGRPRVGSRSRQRASVRALLLEILQWRRCRRSSRLRDDPGGLAGRSSRPRPVGWKDVPLDDRGLGPISWRRTTRRNRPRSTMRSRLPCDRVFGTTQLQAAPRSAPARCRSLSGS